MTEQRLARIESRQDEMIETLAVIRQQVESTNGFVDDLRAEVGRVPLLAARGARLSLTDRMHLLEGNVTPTALEAAVWHALDNRRNAYWTRSQKGFLFLFAAGASVIGLLNFLGYGG